MGLKGTVTILVFLLCLQKGMAQAINFNHLTVENGLSNNSVLAITQDRAGFIWFGTRIGLNRFDGSRFKTYFYNPKDSASVSGNNVISLFCDSRKTLWVGSSAGLNRYNEQLDAFERIELHNKSSLIIHCIYEDKHKTLWIGSSDGLYALPDGNVSAVAVYKATDSNSIAGNFVLQVFEDRSGALWVGTNSGLTRMRQTNGHYVYETFRHQPSNPASLSANYITAITEDAAGQLWIGTQNGGLNRFLPSANSFEHYARNLNESQGLINNNIRTIIPARNGKLWIGTQEGLSILDPATKNISSYQNDAGNKKSLSQNSIYSLFEDVSGSIWVGTYFGGANSTDSYATNFNIIQNHENASSISNNVVSSIVEDSRHNLWIGTEGGGLNYYNRSSGLFTVYKNSLGDGNSLASNLVKVVYVDNDQNVWCGTHGGGLNVFDPMQKKFRRYLYKDNDAATLRSEITSLAEDDNGRFWVVSNFGLKLFKKKGMDIEPLPLGSFQGGERTIIANSIYKDAQGDVWIGGLNCLYRVSGNSIKLISAEFDINSLREDDNGNLWATLTEGGLVSYNKKTAQFTRFSQKDGLPARNMIGMLQDDNGNFWLSTDNGLIKFNPALKTVQTYTVSDGLPGNEFNYNSYLKDSRGEFFFGGYNGLTSFFPDKIETNNYVAPVVFTGLRLFNNTVSINGEDGLLDKNINRAGRVIFRHNQNVFTLEFALLNFVKSSKNRYAYKLEGFDKDWNEVNTNSATYTNLPSGTYTFLVKGANNDGVWSKPASIQIRILPSFWLTWWAYCVYFLLLSGLLFLVIRFFFLRALLKKEDELHQVKLSFFTNVSHEIRTHLTLIMAPVEKLLDSNEENSFVHHQLTHVKSNANRLLKLVSELMDFRKAETDHLKLRVARHNFIPFLQDIYSSFEEMSLAKNIRISFIHNAEDMPLYFDREQLEKVFFNLLVNAFKFTPVGGRICLMAEQKDNKITVTVTDNGRGIAPEFLSNLFTSFFQVADHGLQNTGYGIGLALSKKIVELHKGTISVESEPSVGDREGKTTFSVILIQGNQHFEPAEYYKSPEIIEYAAGTEGQPKLPVQNMASAVTETGSEKPFTILIAEDNAELRTLILETFTPLYGVLHCDNGLQAWEIATEQIPDLIISDIMMPGIDGLTLCSRLKTDERTSHIPVVLLTAKSAQNDQIAGLETGADLYITKPFSIKTLELNVLNLLLARERLRQKFGQQKTVAGQDTIASEVFVNTVDKEFLSRVIQLVDEHLEDPEFGVEKLARKVAMSPPILYKKIKAVTDMSVNEFVKSLRLKKAAQLLQQTSVTVYEVALNVGYKDPKYFSREFKKQFGKTPSEYASGEK